MTPRAHLLLHLIWLLLENNAGMTDLSPSVRQDTRFISAYVGDSIRLKCHPDYGVVTRFYWYKQFPGQGPKIVVSFYNHQGKAVFHNEFEKNPRITLDTEDFKFDLKIADLGFTDSATYYCGNIFTTAFQFAEGTTVIVVTLGWTVRALLHHSASEIAQRGGSETLSCTVHTESCNGEHRVYWFRNTEESHSGLIFTHGDGKDQCDGKINTQPHTCVYNLPTADRNLSHAGIFYCAIHACGHVLFGHRKKFNFVDEVDSFVFEHFLSGAVAFINTMSVLLGFYISRIRGRRCICKGPKSTNSQSHQNEDNPGDNLTGNKKRYSDPQRQRENTWNQCQQSAEDPVASTKSPFHTFAVK